MSNPDSLPAKLVTVIDSTCKSNVYEHNELHGYSQGDWFMVRIRDRVIGAYYKPVRVHIEYPDLADIKKF